MAWRGPPGRRLPRERWPCGCSWRSSGRGAEAADRCSRRRRAGRDAAALALGGLAPTGARVGGAAHRPPDDGVDFWAVLGAISVSGRRRRAPGRGTCPPSAGWSIFSLALTIVAAASRWRCIPSGGPAWWLALFAFLENLLVFTLQAAVPLGFNDGAVLWQAWRRRQSTPGWRWLTCESARFVAANRRQIRSKLLRRQASDAALSRTCVCLHPIRAGRAFDSYWIGFMLRHPGSPARKDRRRARTPARSGWPDRRRG